MPTVKRLWRQLWPLVGAAIIGAIAWVLPELGAELGYEQTDDRIALDLLIGLVSMVTVIFRHRAPFLVAVLIAAGSGFSAAATGALLLALVSLATHRKPAQIAAAVFTVASSALAEWLLPANEQTQWLELPALLILAVTVSMIPVTLGLAIGSRRAEVESLQRETQMLRTEQQANAERARMAERGRIAGELHDELGHRLSVIAVHSAALEYRPDLPAEQRIASIAAIRTAAQQALIDLRHTLGMLAETPPGAEPSPDLGERIAELVDEVRRAGSPIEAELNPTVFTDQTMPAELQRHVFRIVQECLTNTIRHAPRCPVKLEVSARGSNEVVIRVISDLPEIAVTEASPGSGMGLAGIAERVRLVGGQLRVQPDVAGKFEVEAVLPWPK